MQRWIRVVLLLVAAFAAFHWWSGLGPERSPGQETEPGVATPSGGRNAGKRASAAGASAVAPGAASWPGRGPGLGPAHQ